MSSSKGIGNDSQGSELHSATVPASLQDKSDDGKRHRNSSLWGTLRTSLRKSQWSSDVGIAAGTPELKWPEEHHEVLTSDEWIIALKHYPPLVTDQHSDEDGSTTSRQSESTCPPLRNMPPVLLVHGLSANNRVWDLRREHSLAYQLCEEGYDAWMIDLRGSGKSEKSRRRKRAVNWNMLAYMDDVKVAIDYILLRHPQSSQLHLVGHSMGGIIGMMILTADASYVRKIRSLTTLASSLHYQESAWANLAPMLPLANIIDFLDLQTLMRLYAPFVVWPAFVSHITNVRRRDLRKVLMYVEKVPTPALKDLATAFHPEGLHLDFGGGPQRVAHLLRNVSIPILFLAGDFDAQCPIPASRKTWDLINSDTKYFIPVGPKPRHQHHYGHVDILIGANTQTEVFPYIIDFLSGLDEKSHQPRTDLAAFSVHAQGAAHDGKPSKSAREEHGDLSESAVATPRTRQEWEAENARHWTRSPAGSDAEDDTGVKTAEESEDEAGREREYTKWRHVVDHAML